MCVAQQQSAVSIRKTEGRYIGDVSERGALNGGYLVLEVGRHSCSGDLSRGRHDCRTGGSGDGDG